MFALVMVSLGSASASEDNSQHFFSYQKTPNGISNFTVFINNRSLEVIKYFNISSNLSEFEMPYVGSGKLTTIDWQGNGGVTVVPSVSFSRVGNFSYSGGLLSPENINYVLLYSGSYLGALYSTGKISEQYGSIYISDPSVVNQLAVSFMTSPVSYYASSNSNYTISGNSFVGSYSAFSYSNGVILNYSLLGNGSSVNIFSKLGGPIASSAVLASGISELDVPSNISIYASDGIAPLIYASEFGSSINISLVSGFSLVPSGHYEFMIPPDRGEDGLNSWLNIAYTERSFRIMSQNGLIGDIEVFGSSAVNSSSLELNSAVSFILIKFLPLSQMQTGHGPTAVNEIVENASSEIFVEEKPYFIPLSPNVTSLNLSFQGNTLRFDFLHNGSGIIMVFFTGSYSISSFSLSGITSEGNQYSVQRASNNTFVLFNVTGNGTESLTMSVVPYVHSIPLTYLGLISGASLLVIIIAVSSILYSRRKFAKEFEKE